MKRVLLLGSYGQTNLGDDVLMYNYLQFLASKGYDEIYVNANTSRNIPATITQQFPRLIVFQTYNTGLLALLRIFAKVNCVVYGGGTIFKELYSSTGRSPYSVIIRIMLFNVLARILGKPVYNLHIGIGTLNTWTGRMITRLSLRASTKTIFRDKKSYQVARKLRVSTRKISHQTDGLFINPVWRDVWHKKSLRLPKGRPIVGVNVLSDIPDWIDRKTYIRTMRDFLQRLTSEGAFIVFVPFQHAFNPHNDHVFMQREIVPGLHKKDYVLLSSVAIDEISHVLRQLDVLIGMRFHSLLLATVNQVPFVALSYDTKCTRFLQESNYIYMQPLETFTTDNLYAIYHDALNHAPAIRKQLTTIAETNFKLGMGGDALVS